MKILRDMGVWVWVVGLWRDMYMHCFDGYCSTVQGLLDWVEVDSGFTKLSFIQIDLCVLCVFVVCFCSLLPRLTLLLSFLDILHCLPRAVGVRLESALNLVSPMSPCRAHDTHACCARSNDHFRVDVAFHVKYVYTYWPYV